MNDTFEKLPKYAGCYSTAIASIQTNKHRNRYFDILPYDHSLVLVKNNCNIYINASRIPIGNEKYVIATQGPMVHTLYDFWSMILCEKPECIVMLTPFCEKGIPKCASYMPEEGCTKECMCEPVCQRCDKIIIECVENLKTTAYEISTLRITKGIEQYTLTHFFYTCWYDHKIPQEDDFLEFMNYVQSVFNKKIVVHCSAGVGRTGTFIAILRCVNKNEAPFESVSEIRKYRCQMVQTREQYEFISSILKKL